jgi:hypothetical protein
MVPDQEELVGLHEVSEMLGLSKPAGGNLLFTLWLIAAYILLIWFFIGRQRRT